jgi:hypothetical protein
LTYPLQTEDVRLVPDILTARTASYAMERDIFAIFAALEVDWDVVNIYTHLLERYPTRTYIGTWDINYKVVYVWTICMLGGSAEHRNLTENLDTSDCNGAD